MTHGIQKGEPVITIFNNNCPQWNFIDMALAKMGAVHVPVYPSSSDSDYLYILNQTKARYAIVSDQIIYNKLSVLQKDIPSLETIYTVESLPNIHNIDELMQLGISGRNVKSIFAKRQEEISEDDVVTIVYTSGSTGLPKGVMLTHRNLISNMYAAVERIPLDHRHKVMSFLPLCHVYERTANYLFQFLGTSIYYCENLRSISRNLKEIKPQGVTVVPRLLEKVIKVVAINSRKGNFFIRLIVNSAMSFGFRYRPYHTKETLLYKFGYYFANLFLYRFVRNNFGGKIKYIGCGGAHLNPKVTRFFWAARMPVFEGYGLTECSPLVALNYPEKENFRLGTVGPVINNMEVKIADDGEILCKGPGVMKGYFCQEELTRKTIIDGWFYTGDVGILIHDKYLKVTGRKKQMFKTSYGRYVVPQAIESKFVGSDIIDYIMIIGEGKHCAAAIISPVFGNLRKIVETPVKPSNAKLIEMPLVKNMIQKEIDHVNITLGRTERIRMHLIVGDEWTVDSGELSPTLKIKRNIILKKYHKQIQDLYRKDCL